jgi:hypothetical protein
MLLRLAPIFLCLLAQGCSSQPSISEAQKRTSLSWLQLIDNRAYEASWEASAPLFQKAISKQNWARQVASVRTPMGPLMSRTLTSSDVRENLAGQPQGIYTIFIYHSSFVSKPQALETHTVYRANSGEPWQNAGYFIK